MKINVVGLGPGNIKYISSAGIDCIKEAEIFSWKCKAAFRSEKRHFRKTGNIYFR